MNLAATNRMRSVTDLRDVYDAKCSQLGVPPNLILRQQLEILDAMQSTTLDLSSIAVDRSFECAMEVAVLSSSIRTIDLSRSNMTDREVDILVHNLRRSVSVSELILSGNPRITDKGGLYLLDVVHARGTITAILLDGTGISQKMMQRLDVAVEENLASAEKDTLEDALMLSQQPSGLQKCESLAIGHPHSGADSSDLYRVVALATRLSLIAVRGGEDFMALLCWERPFKTLCILVVILASIFTSQRMLTWPLVFCFLLLQHRVHFAYLPRGHADASENVLDDDSPMYCELAKLRRLRRLIEVMDAEGNFASASAVESVFGSILEFLGKFKEAEFRRILAEAVLAIFAAGLFISPHILFALLVLVLFSLHFVFGPLSMTLHKRWPRSELLRWHTDTRRHLAKQERDSTDEFHESFPFVVQIMRLVGIEVECVSKRRFIPFVQVKYNKRSWVSRRVHEPWIWEEESPVLYFKPGALRISFNVFDDAGDMVGPVCTGDLIVDSTLDFGEAIFLPLQSSEHRQSVLCGLVDDIAEHRAATRSRYMQVASSTAGSIPQFILSKPGSLVVRVHRIGSGTPRNVPSVPRLPLFRTNPEAPLPKRSARDSSPVASASSRLPAVSAQRPESIVREASSTAPNTGRIVYQAHGNGSVVLPEPRVRH